MIHHHQSMPGGGAKQTNPTTEFAVYHDVPPHQQYSSRIPAHPTTPTGHLGWNPCLYLGWYLLSMNPIGAMGVSVTVVFNCI